MPYAMLPMIDENKISIEMLNDIILVFLLGIHSGPSDYIRSFETSAWSTWSDIFSLRSRIVDTLLRSDKTKALGQALKETYDTLLG